MSDPLKKAEKTKDKKAKTTMESDSIKIDLEDEFSMDMDVDDEVHLVEEEDTKSGSKRKQHERKDRSVVWNYFIKHTKKKVGQKVPTECKKCHHVMIYHSGQGTGNHTKHLRSCYGDAYKDIGQMLLNSDMKLKSSSFSNNTFREKLIDAIVMHELPLSFVEYKAFKDLFKYLQPDVNIPSRNIVKSDLVQKFKREKEKMKAILMESPGRLFLTGDLWTSITTDGYLAITVHYIDKHWVLQKRVLSFSFMPPPHTGVALCEKVFSILGEWGIEKKISVTLENASSNDAFIRLLREQLNTKSPLVSKGAFFSLEMLCLYFELDCARWAKGN